MSERDDPIDEGYVPGRWWRVMRDGKLWCETSDEQEARESMSPGDSLCRWWVPDPKAGEWRAVI